MKSLKVNSVLCFLFIFISLLNKYTSEVSVEQIEDKYDLASEIPINQNPYLEINDYGFRINDFVMVDSVSEINQNGLVSREYFLSAWEVIATANQFNYSTSFNNVNISVIIDFLTENTTVNFANETFEVPPLSLKYTIKISSYPFSNPLNKLVLTMKVSLLNSHSSRYSKIESGSTSVFQEYMIFQLNNYTIYGRFVNKAIIDGRIGGIGLTFQEPIEDVNYTSSYARITIPNYQNSVEIDPDFTVNHSDYLVTDSSSSSSISSNYIIILMILVLLGLF